MSDADRLQIHTAVPDDYPAIVGIQALAGEHMHRVQQMSHWYPWKSVEQMAERLKGRTAYLATLDDIAVATFDLSDQPERYHEMSRWPDSDVRAAYFGGFAVLPTYWGRGIGERLAEYAVELATQDGFEHFRFDGVTANTALVAWYQKIGFTPVGITHATPTIDVTCFERRLNGESH